MVRCKLCRRSTRRIDQFGQCKDKKICRKRLMRIQSISGEELLARVIGSKEPK